MTETAKYLRGCSGERWEVWGPVLSAWQWQLTTGQKEAGRGLQRSSDKEQHLPLNRQHHTTKHPFKRSNDAIASCIINTTPLFNVMESHNHPHPNIHSLQRLFLITVPRPLWQLTNCKCPYKVRFDCGLTINQTRCYNDHIRLSANCIGGNVFKVEWFYE